MPTLYVIEPGARLEKEYGRLLVTLEDEIILRVPIQRVTQVVLVGSVGVTTPALHALLEVGIPLLLVRRSGALIGRLLPPTPANLPLRQAQYQRNDDPTFCLALAQAIVAGKIANQCVMANRLIRRRRTLPWQGSSDLRRLEHAARKAADMGELLGTEGHAARTYFALLKEALDPEWKFSRRTRRPPKDPVNALLSLGYTFLGHAAAAALEIVGLDPYLGFFHAEKYGRPALALDLVEEFRAPIVDSLVLDILGHRMLGETDFETGSDGGVYLTTRGLRVFLRKFGQRLESRVTPRAIGRAISYRKLFEVQARKMARVILGEETRYRPYRLR
jgi:CRISPR-associated protein Cas1